MKWTQGADDMLVRLWAERMTQGEIAKAIMATHGGDLDRAAVAGRKRRLAAKGIEFEARDSPIKVPPLPQFVEHDNGVDYMALGSRGCKAILDKRGADGLSMCCGKERHGADSYCSHHNARYLNPNYIKGKHHG